jgi:hypothetical protein
MQSTTPHPLRTCWLLFLLVDAHALSTIRLAILMSTIDRGKVIQVRDSITTNYRPSVPPIRRTHLAVLVRVLHPPCVNAMHHI